MNSKENSRKIFIITNETMDVAQEFYNETKAKNPLPYRELNDNCNLFNIVGRNAPELQDAILRLMIRGNDFNCILDYVYGVSLLGSGFYRKNAKQLYQALLRNSHEIEGKWSC